MTTISVPSSRPAPAGPRPLRWTCAEFHRFGDMGVFEGRRAMLIDGVILEEGPMNPPHAITLGLVEEAVRTAFGAGWWLRQQSPLILGQSERNRVRWVHRPLLQDDAVDEHRPPALEHAHVAEAVELGAGPAERPRAGRRGA